MIMSIARPRKPHGRRELNLSAWLTRCNNGHCNTGMNAVGPKKTTKKPRPQVAEWWPNEATQAPEAHAGLT